MNRLGVSLQDALQFTRSPYGIMSHFAESGLPQHPKTLHQIENILSMCDKFHSSHRSFSNSNAIKNSLLGSLETHVRPGISLYTGLSSDQSVFDWKTQILQLQDLKKGDSVGYSFTYTASQNKKIAILGAGYADGIPRSLSNNGYFWLNGTKVPILGTVCMDLTAIDVSDLSAKKGDEVSLIRAGSDLKNINQFSGMIDYELLTGLSPRNERFIR